MRSVEARLAAGDYEGALARLERAYGRGDPEAALLAAEIWALFGPDEAARLKAALDAAGPRADEPLGRALKALLSAWQGRRPRLFIARGRAAYHLAAAALELGEPEEVLHYLEAAGTLPAFLGWRRALLRGRAFEQLGRFPEALEAYLEAMKGAPKVERPYLAMDAAAVLLELDRGGEALALLEATPPAEANPLWHYLRARALLAGGNPRAALEALEEAERLDGDPYEVALLMGQIWMRLGEPEEARAAFERALEHARPEEKSYVLHELAVAMIEGGDPEAALEPLKAALADPDYPHRGGLFAELAGAHYRLGLLAATERYAAEAVAQGAAAAGYLYLGHAALDRGALKEALDYYRRAAEAAEEGSPDWVTAQQLAADVLAQLGFPDPEEALARAQAALAHTPPYDEWAETLKGHIQRARQRRRLH